MLSSTTKKICEFMLKSLFSSSATPEGGKESSEEPATEELDSDTSPSSSSVSNGRGGCEARRRTGCAVKCCSSEPEPTRPSAGMGAIKCCGNGGDPASPKKAPGSFETGQMEKGKSGECCKCDLSSDTGSCGSLNKRVLNYQDAPFYLRFNPYITGGYRSSLSPRDCIKSLFWWTNETINIWTHLTGWFFFLGLSVYDALGLLDLPTSHPWDQIVITLLLVCFQACMLLSSLYHIFCCHSEKFYRRWLSADLLGVSLSLLAIYISGIYYAFSCVPFWLNFYLVTVGAIFATAMGMQILPMLSRKDMVTEENFHLRLIVFGGWAAYGVIPTFHWAILHGGMSSPAVALLLPRIAGMYIISAIAFFFYVARLPERLWPGLVNFVGSSHQLWHILIVAALYHWHNTGMLYLHFRATHPCSEEYAYLFPTTDVVE